MEAVTRPSTEEDEMTKLLIQDKSPKAMDRASDEASRTSKGVFGASYEVEKGEGEKGDGIKGERERGGSRKEGRFFLR